VTAPPRSLGREHISGTIFETINGVVRKKRIEMPELQVSARVDNFRETDLVISESDAISESNRCLSCCRLCYNPDVTKKQKVAA